VSDHLEEENENLDHLFAPGRIAQIDSVIAKVNAGAKTYTVQEVRENLAQNREDWILKTASEGCGHAGSANRAKRDLELERN